MNSKEKYPLVGIQAVNTTCKDVYFLRGKLKSLFISAFANKEQLKKDGSVVVITCNGLDIVPTEKLFAEFQTDGVSTYNRHTFTYNGFKVIF